MDIRNFFTKKRQLDDEDSPTGNNPSCSAEAKNLQTLSKAQDENIQNKITGVCFEHVGLNYLNGLSIL